MNTIAQILRVAALVVLVARLSAQEPPQSFANSHAELFEHVNFSQLGTPYFIHKSPYFNQVSLFNGTTDAPAADYNTLRFGYMALYYAQMQETGMEDPISFFEGYEESYDTDDPNIDLSFIDVTATKFYDDALETGKLTVRNNQFYNVPGQNPFEEVRVMVCAPNVHTLHISSGTELRFNLPMQNVYSPASGNANPFSEFAIDFNLGQGYENVALNNLPGANQVFLTPYTSVTNFSRPGSYKVDMDFRFKLQGESQYRYAAASFFIVVEREDPPAFGLETVVIDPTQEHSGGAIRIDYSCFDNRIRKPLIFIEGYDPDNSEDLDDGLRTFNATAQNNVTLRNILVRDSDYDIVILNPNDGGDDIRRNAALLRDVIRLINERKEANGSVEKNVVMGGIVARYALRTMELNGEDHQCNRLITVDSPHNGAVVDPGFHALYSYIYDFSFSITADFPVVGEVVLKRIPLRDLLPEQFERINDLVEYPNSMAARQLLIQRQNLPALQSSLHDDLFQELRAIGLPEQTENIAITNGSLLNDNIPGFNAGDRILKIRQAIPLLLVFGYTSVDIYSVPASGSGKVFDLYIKGKVLGVYSDDDHATHNVQGLKPLVHSAGGFESFDDPLDGTHPDVRNFLEFFGDIEFEQPIQNFVPVNSAIGVRNWDQNFNIRPIDFADDFGAITDFDRILGPGLNGVPNQNEDHATLNPTVVTQLADILAFDDEILNVLTINTFRSFNFGSDGTFLTSNIITNSKKVTANAYIGVNADLPLGQNGVTLATPTEPNFLVNVGEGCASPAVISIEIQDDASLTVGATNAELIGQLVFLRNTELILREGSSLRISEGSTVHITPEAAITIEPGASITVEPGGQLLIEGDFDIPENGNGLAFTGGGLVSFLSSGTFPINSETTLSVEGGTQLITVESIDVNYAGDKVMQLTEGASFQIAGEVNLAGGSVFGIANSSDPDHGYISLVRPLSSDEGIGVLNNFFYCNDSENPAAIDISGSGGTILKTTGRISISSGDNSATRNNYIKSMRLAGGIVDLEKDSRLLLYTPVIDIDEVTVEGEDAGSGPTEVLALGCPGYTMGGLSPAFNVSSCVFDNVSVTRHAGTFGDGAEVRVGRPVLGDNESRCQFNNRAISRVSTYNSDFTGGSHAIISSKTILGCTFRGTTNIPAAIDAFGTCFIQGNSIEGYHTGVKINTYGNVGFGCNDIRDNHRGVYIGTFAFANMAAEGLRDNTIVDNHLTNIHHEYSRLVNLVNGDNTLYNNEVTHDGGEGPYGGLILSGYFRGNCVVDEGSIYNLRQNQWSSDNPNIAAPQFPAFVDPRKFTLKMGNAGFCNTCDVEVVDSNPTEDEGRCDPNQPISRPVVPLPRIDLDGLGLGGFGNIQNTVEATLGNSSECLLCPQIEFNNGQRMSLPSAINYAASFSTIAHGTDNAMSLNLFLEIFQGTEAQTELLNEDVAFSLSDEYQLLRYLHMAYSYANMVTNELIATGNLEDAATMLEIFQAYRLEQYDGAMAVDVYAKALDQANYYNLTGSYQDAVDLVNSVQSELNSETASILESSAESIATVARTSLAFISEEIGETEFSNVVNALVGNGPGGTFTTPDGGWDPCGNGGRLQEDGASQIAANLITAEDSDTKEIPLQEEIKNSGTSSNSNFKVFPNPTTDELNIWVSETGVVQATLIDGLGKMVYSEAYKTQATVRINTANLSPGIYLLKTETADGGTHSNRILIQ